MNNRTFLTAAGTARPLRVAYLVDSNQSPPALFDEIFAESYSRWGGRRTPIIPTTLNGVDERYSEWLAFYDADILYSFLDLTDETVTGIHERYCPAHLIRHDPSGRNRSDPNYYRIELPFQGVSSLSVIPAFLSRSWGLRDRVTKLEILNSFWDRNYSPILKENFGFLDTSFGFGPSRSFPDLFTCLTLISQEARDNRGLGKDRNAQYEVEEEYIFECLGQSRSLVTLAQLSEFFSPHLETDRKHRRPSGLNLVAGDSFDDRLVFWNGHNSYGDIDFAHVTSFRIPEQKLLDTAFLDLLNGVLTQRGHRSDYSSNQEVTLVSCSLNEEKLKKAAELLRESTRLSVRVKHLESHAGGIPRFNRREGVRTTHGSWLRSLTATKSTEFTGNRFHVPAAVPWHLRESPPPAGMRQGSWMIDVSVDRQDDHSRYSNIQHVWVLPRRLRIESAFAVDWQESWYDGLWKHSIRVERKGQLTLPHELGRGTPIITVPSDLDAFRKALCADYEWTPFDRYTENALSGLPRYRYAQLSDKGRYLLAVLGHFDTVPGAFDVLLNAFWRDALIELGAAPAEKNQELLEGLTRTLRKRLKKQEGSEISLGIDQLELVAREAIRFGRSLRRPKRYVRYGSLKEKWESILQQYAQKHNLKEVDKRLERKEGYVDLSLQYLCQREVLYQGREWRCSACYNRNWVPIDAMGHTLTCEVCRRTEPAPVSGDWHFSANNFIIEAYSDHGVEAVIWTLWKLSKRAERSFFFAPSMWLWDQYPEDATPVAEFDVLVVVDGELHLCEAKTSPSLTDHDVQQLISVGNVIRPDVLLITCMDQISANVRSAQNTIESNLIGDTRVEVLGFDGLEPEPFLPY